MRVGPQAAPVAGGVRESTDGVPGAGPVRGYLGYRQSSPTPVGHWETPAAEVVVVIGTGDVFHVQAAPEAEPTSAFTSFVAGIHDRPTQTVHHGDQRGVQIRLDPLGAFSLFGVPMHELGNRIVGLTDLLGADWTGQLLDVPDWQACFTRLDRMLTERMAAGPAPSPKVVQAWRTMRRVGGVVRISDLAAEVGCSHRHLVALFREQIGTTPKNAARVLRYERAARLLSAGGRSPAEVAVEAGYADQPHLTREFQRFAHVTPTMAARPPA